MQFGINYATLACHLAGNFWGQGGGDQLVLRLQILICRHTQDEKWWTEGYSGRWRGIGDWQQLTQEHLTLQHVFNSISTGTTSRRPHQGSRGVGACENL